MLQFFSFHQNKEVFISPLLCNLGVLKERKQEKNSVILAFSWIFFFMLDSYLVNVLEFGLALIFSFIKGKVKSVFPLGVYCIGNGKSLSLSPIDRVHWI